MSNPVRLSLVLAVLSFLVALGFMFARHAPSVRPAPEKLTVAIAEQPASALLYIAQARGYFAAEGLEVTFNRFAIGRDALRSMLDGKADLATTFQTPVVMQVYQGEKLGIVSTLHTSSASHALVVRRDRIAAAADLRGRRIGTTPGTSTEYFLSLLLASTGVRPSEVTTVAVEPADYEQALASDSVDALVAFNPILHQLMQSGNGRLAALRSDVYVETSMLVAQRATLEARGDAVTRLLRALVRAEDFAASNREASLRIVVEQLAGRFPEAAIREGWDALRLEVRLDHVLLTLLAEEGRWSRDSGRFKTPVPDFRESLAPRLLREVRPQAVTLVATPAER